ncbi:MAG TPA: hypothetical protein VG838_12225 [Opitutaceae bacterium]|nr:hypothetical protein [Opitutaceae bacterium]
MSAGPVFPRAMRAAAVFLVLVFVVLVARFWHPVYGFTRFLQLDASNDAAKIAAFRTYPVYVYRDTGGYDGLYYAQIAHHPSLAAPELAHATDNLAYRARRILPPALAWLAAGGQEAWIAQAYALLNVAAWLALAWLLWRLLPDDGRGLLAWAGVLFSAGALGSVRFALTDLVALVIVAAAVQAAEQQRPGRATALLGAAGLARETSLLAFGGLWERPWLSPRMIGRALLAAIPLLAWLVYVRWRVGAGDPGWSNFDLPFTGFFGKWRSDLTAALASNPAHRWLIWTTLLATFGVTVQAVFFLRHRQTGDAWWRTGAIYAALLCCLGPAVWEGYPGAETRVLLPLALAFNVMAARTRASVCWLLLGNLGVFSGLMMITDVHRDPRELGAARIAGTAVVAEVGDGWYGVERSSRHTWSWNEGRGLLSLHSWPAGDRAVRVTCTLRSLQPTTVTVTQDGAVRWRGTVGPSTMAASFPVPIAAGTARLEFSSDAAGVKEDAALGGRTLAFAVYDLRFAVPETTP